MSGSRHEKLDTTMKPRNAISRLRQPTVRRTATTSDTSQKSSTCQVLLSMPRIVKRSEYSRRTSRLGRIPSSVKNAGMFGYSCQTQLKSCSPNRIRKAETGATSICPNQNSRRRVNSSRPDASVLWPCEELFQTEALEDAVQRDRDVERRARASRRVTLKTRHDDLRQSARDVLDLVERRRVERQLRIALLPILGV